MDNKKYMNEEARLTPQEVMVVSNYTQECKKDKAKMRYHEDVVESYEEDGYDIVANYDFYPDGRISSFFYTKKLSNPAPVTTLLHGKCLAFDVDGSTILSKFFEDNNYVKDLNR